MNAWEHFLKELGGAEEIFLVGPLHNGRYLALGPTVFVDGGAKARGLAASQTSFPEISVGDGDSYPSSLDFQLPKDKDYSDLAFVLRHLPNSVRHIHLLGFLGGRRDHELANLGEAHSFLRTRTAFSTISFDSAVTGFNNGELKSEIQGAFAVLVLESCRVKITGACRYLLAQPTLLDPLSSRGISNSGSGEVVLSADKPVFLFRQGSEHERA